MRRCNRERAGGSPKRGTCTRPQPMDTATDADELSRARLLYLRQDFEGARAMLEEMVACGDASPAAKDLLLQVQKEQIAERRRAAEEGGGGVFDDGAPEALYRIVAGVMALSAVYFA